MLTAFIARRHGGASDANELVRCPAGWPIASNLEKTKRGVAA